MTNHDTHLKKTKKLLQIKVVETCLFTPSIPCDYQITITDCGRYIAENDSGDRLEGHVSKRQNLIDT